MRIPGNGQSELYKNELGIKWQGLDKIKVHGQCKMTFIIFWPFHTHTHTHQVLGIGI